jgi:glycosyltransferase involved in cell wall biosynthesis
MVLPQLQGLENEVEVIVSDNCSTDDTGLVVQQARQYGPLTYHRTECNIGAGPNFFLSVNEWAKGEYCWLIGDDDFLIKGSVTRLVSILKENSKVDMFLANCITNGKPASKNLMDFRTIFDLLIDPELNPACFAFLPTTIFRRKPWSEMSREITVSIDNFRSVGTTYPHSLCLVKSMMRRPCFYIGDPLFTATRAGDWQDKYPLLWLVRFLEFLDYLECLGIDKRRIERYRKICLRKFSSSLLLLHLQGKAECSVSKYVFTKSFWESMFFVPAQMIGAQGAVSKIEGWLA